MRREMPQSGFTLIEIAIVLVVIGLLLGGVLKGQELINSAKAKNMANDFRSIPVLVYGYQDKYRALPGDDPAARSHLGETANQIAAASAAGTAGNGRIDGPWDSAAANDETFVLWQHLRLAGLATGPTNTGDPGYLPRNADGGTIGIESAAQGGSLQPYIRGISGTYLMCSTSILGRLAKQIDRMVDDGNGASGQIRVVAASYARNAGSGLDNVSDPGSIDDASQYTVCMGF